MIGALLLYAAVSIGIYTINGAPPPEGYTHYDVCVRCGEDHTWVAPFDSAIGNGSFDENGNPQQMIIVEEN